MCVLAFIPDVHDLYFDPSSHHCSIMINEIMKEYTTEYAVPIDIVLPRIMVVLGRRV